MSKQQYGGFLVIILLGMIALEGCTARFFQFELGQPKLPVQSFLHKQNDVLSPGWTIGGVYIWTDTDFTLAGWAVATGFIYKNDVDEIMEEIHVFGSSFAARLIPDPSPSSVNAGKGYIPEVWTYYPHYADRFKFGCTGGDGAMHPDSCSLIVRYRNYVFVIFSPITEYMTLEDLRRLLEVIDREMADFLQHSTLRPGRVPYPNHSILDGLVISSCQRPAHSW